MKKHPNKQLREAIKHAMANGWEIAEAGKSAHAFCRVRCAGGHTEHQMSIWSTPKSPENHAKQILHKVQQCRDEQQEQ